MFLMSSLNNCEKGKTYKHQNTTVTSTHQLGPSRIYLHSLQGDPRRESFACPSIYGCSGEMDRAEKRQM